MFLRKSVLCSTALVASLALSAPARAQAADPSAQAVGNGTLTGQVIDPRTGEYLRGAIVEVVAANGEMRTETTGESGLYIVHDLPAGRAQVTVRFTGYTREQAEVEIAARGTAKLDFSLREPGKSGAEKASDIVVSGVREGDARAIMAQRESMNIAEVLSTESYGDIADTNPAEFLKYMPGVDTDGTNGTAINVYLRGLPQDYTTVTINGMNLVSADANTGSGSARVFSFEAMSLVGIDSIEIDKTTSADVDANAPAGRIDIRTKRAFNRRKSLFTIQFSGSTHENMWDSRSHTGPQSGGWGGRRFRPNAQISYSNSFFDHRLGVSASLGLSDTYIEREEITLSRDYKPTAISPEALGITKIGPEMSGRETKRLAGTINIDFKATNSLTLSVMGAANRGSVYQGVVSPAFTTGVRSAGVTGDPYFDFTTNQKATAGTYSIARSNQNKINNGNFIAPSFEWNHENLKVDGYFSYSDAESYYNSPARGEVTTMTSALSSTGNFSASRDHDLKAGGWDITQVSGPDWGDPASFGLANSATRPVIRTTNGSTANVDNKSAALNLTFDTKFGAVPIEFKTGGKLSDTTFEFNDTSGDNLYTYNGPLSNLEFLQQIQGNQDISLSDSGGSITTLNGGGYLYTPDLAKLYDMLKAHPEEWTHTLTPANWLASRVNNYAHYEENIKALYAMATAHLTPKLTLRAGLRWEHTGTTTMEFDPLLAADVEAAGFAVDPKTGQAKTNEGLEYQYFSRPMVARTASYSNFFPSAALKYDFDRHTQIQAGYSRTILRPEPDVLAGVTIVDPINETVSAPNPGVKPAISDNFSVRLARYFEPVGIVAIGAYLNRVDGLFQSYELTAQEFGYTGTEYANYTFITTRTVPGAAVNIKGLEFEFNHAMTYLPGPLSHLSVRGSFMYNKPDVPIVRVADKIGTLSLSYHGGPLKLNLNSVWTGNKYRSTTPSWFDQRWDVSLNGAYRFQRNLEAFFSISNLLNKPINVIVPGSLGADGTLADHSAIYVHNGRNGVFGIRARF